jgi:hypothetical protein
MPVMAAAFSVVSAKPGSAACARDEERHSRGPLRIVAANGVAGVGQRERSHRHHVFPRQPQRLTAGGQDAQSWSDSQEIGHERSGIEKVLEVIKNQQHGTLAQVGGELVGDRCRSCLPEAEGGGDFLSNKGRVTHRSQIDEDHAVAKVAAEQTRRGDGEAGLAAATGAGQGQQPQLGCAQKRRGRRDLFAATDQGGGGNGERPTWEGRRTV